MIYSEVVRIYTDNALAALLLGSKAIRHAKLRKLDR